MTLSKKEISPSHRRQAVRLGVGLGLGAVLAACGGGGGGDDNAGQESKLQEAFEQIVAGMTWVDVERLVGFPANEIRNPTWLLWQVGRTSLNAGFQSTGGNLITDKTLKIGDSPSVGQSFYY